MDVAVTIHSQTEAAHIEVSLREAHYSSRSRSVTDNRIVAMTRYAITQAIKERYLVASKFILLYIISNAHVRC